MKKIIFILLVLTCATGLSALDFQLGGGYTAALESSAALPDEITGSSSSNIYPAGVNLYGGAGISVVPMLLAIGAEYEYVGLLDCDTTENFSVSYDSVHSPKAYAKVQLPLLISASVLVGADIAGNFSSAVPVVGLRVALFNVYVQYTASFSDSVLHRAAIGYSIFK